MVWVQEEPENMGALSFVMPRLRRLVKDLNGTDRHVLSCEALGRGEPCDGEPEGA